MRNGVRVEEMTSFGTGEQGHTCSGKHSGDSWSEDSDVDTEVEPSGALLRIRSACSVCALIDGSNSLALPFCGRIITKTA